MTRFKVVGVLAIIAALAIPALAGPSKAIVRLSVPATLAGTTLEAGEYQVIATDTKVTIKLSRRNKALLEADANWAEATAKEEYNTCIIKEGVIKEIRFAGKTKYLVFK